jgi:hypothetical protein
MGCCDWSQIGVGVNERAARQDAYDTDRDEHGHEDGYSGSMGSSTYEKPAKCLVQPKLAKTCKIEKTVQKGARKWETVFVLEPSWEGSCGKYAEEMRNATQGQAIARAKHLALKTQKEYSIRIEKRLIGRSLVATVAPKKSKMGKWLFSGEARC